MRKLAIWYRFLMWLSFTESESTFLLTSQQVALCVADSQWLLDPRMTMTREWFSFIIGCTISVAVSNLSFVAWFSPWSLQQMQSRWTDMVMHCATTGYMFLETFSLTLDNMSWRVVSWLSHLTSYLSTASCRKHISSTAVNEGKHNLSWLGNCKAGIMHLLFLC